MDTPHFAMTEKKWMVLDFGMEDIGNNISLVEDIISQVGFQTPELGLLLASTSDRSNTDYRRRKQARTKLKPVLSHLCRRFEAI